MLQVVDSCIPSVMKQALTHGFSTEYKFRISAIQQVLRDSNCVQGN